MKIVENFITLIFKCALSPIANESTEIDSLKNLGKKGVVVQPTPTGIGIS